MWHSAIFAITAVCLVVSMISDVWLLFLDSVCCLLFVVCGVGRREDLRYVSLTCQ